MIQGEPEDGPGSVGGDGSSSEPVSADSDQPRPVHPALAGLLADLDNDTAVLERFVSDFLSLLDARLATIGSLVRADDLAAAAVALQSLRTTSAMVGAEALARLAEDFHDHLGSEPLDVVDARLAALAAAAEQFRKQLR